MFVCLCVCVIGLFVCKSIYISFVCVCVCSMNIVCVC